MRNTEELIRRPAAAIAVPANRAALFRSAIAARTWCEGGFPLPPEIVQLLTLQRTFNPYPGRHLGRSAGVTPLFLNFAIAALVWLQRALRLRFCQ